MATERHRTLPLDVRIRIQENAYIDLARVVAWLVATGAVTFLAL